MRASLELSDVSSGYEERTIVSGISLDVQDGEIVALFGANGAGKSTILKSIARTAPLLSGSIFVQGKSTLDLKAHQLPGLGVGIVLQGYAVFPSLSVWDNLLVASSNRGVAAKHAAYLAATAIPEVEKLLGKTASLLSGGERQLVALARALVNDPKVMLLDEPGAGLAPDLLQRVLELLKTQAQGNRRSILIVEQHVTSVLPFADRVAVLNNGRIVYFGPASRVDPPTLARLMLSFEESGTIAE